MLKDLVVSFVITLFERCFANKDEKRKERREDALAAKSEQQEIFRNRPEFDIIEYKNYLSRPGYGIKKKCDIEVFVAHIDHVEVEVIGKKLGAKTGNVFAHFHPDDLNTKDWCCVIYVLKNEGKTDISTTNIICHYQKDTCLFPAEYADRYMKENILSYSIWHDRKIRSGRTVTLKLCYHKDRIMAGAFSANMSIGMQDDNGNCWEQPLFAPEDKVYNSEQVTLEQYRKDMSADSAIECFLNPALW